MTSPSSAGFSFEVHASDGHARTGTFKTPHADVATPSFMPVGTQGSVKGLTGSDVAKTGAQIVLGNTYHLWLRPGAELVAEMGGLHEFSRWPRAMLTDSGGFQAFSLGVGAKGKESLVKFSEEGIAFRSHLDGEKKWLSPEEAVRVQGLIGADIQMQLDVCAPGGAPREAVVAAVDRTTRWAQRALATPRPEGQALFGIVQGGVHVDLRKRHAEELGAMPFDGLALGGFSVGEPIEQMHEALPEVAPLLDPERPRYLMGVGTPKDLLIGIGAGVDLFDCVLPTRNARNGQALTRFGKLVVKQARWKHDKRPLDEKCKCEACAGGYSRAYLRHLYLAGEMSVLRLISIHNLHYYAELTAGARDAIRHHKFAQYRRHAEAAWAAGED